MTLKAQDKRLAFLFQAAPALRQPASAPEGSTSFRVRKSKAPEFPFAAKKTPENEEFSPTPLPLLMLSAVHNHSSDGISGVQTPALTQQRGTFLSDFSLVMAV